MVIHCIWGVAIRSLCAREFCKGASIKDVRRNWAFSDPPSPVCPALSECQAPPAGRPTFFEKFPEWIVKRTDVTKDEWKWCQVKGENYIHTHSKSIKDGRVRKKNVTIISRRLIIIHLTKKTAIYFFHFRTSECSGPPSPPASDFVLFCQTPPRGDRPDVLYGCPLTFFSNRQIWLNTSF